MKKCSILLLSFLFSLFFNMSFAQLDPLNSECGTSTGSTFSSGPSRGASCANTGVAWMTKYRTPGYWIPDNSTPIKTILINIVACRDNAGLNGWQDSPTFRADLDLLFANINYHYSNIQPKGYSLTCEPTINQIVDTRIRFEINQVIFIDNTTFNQTCSFGGISAIDAYVRANYPSAYKGMNHIFTSPPALCGYLGFYLTSGNNAFVHTSGMWDSFYMNHPDYINHFCHEYGHALGLHHTYDAGEELQISSFDFLDDVFGTCPELSMSDPSNPCWALCGIGTPPGPCAYPAPLSGYVSPLHKCFFSQISGDPIMCGNGTPTYISPKSAGRMHRSLSLFNNAFRTPTYPMHKYVKERYSYAIPLEIASSETWDFAIQLYQDIVVKTGATLTITCEVRMPINGKIIVEKGARLIIDGGVITSAWEDRIFEDNQWEGIQIAGTKSQPQTIVAGGLSPYQGIVEMKNNATLENARTAIHTGTYTPAGGIDFGSFGGIILASNSNFLNNNRDVAFLLYPTYNNKSYFNNCKFDINTNHYIGMVPNAHITMWGVKNVNIRGCDFSNSAYTDFPTGGAGTGIYTIDAKYNVIDYCSSFLYPCPSASIKRSTFDHLDYGINSSNSDPLVNLNINHAIFTNFTYDAIHLAGVNYPSVLNCSFDVGTYSYANAGLYLDYCKYYQVQNNQFFTTSGGYVGMYVKDSKTGAHEVYRNTFTGLLAGIIPLNDNSGVSNYVDGLTMHCNIFSGNNYDIAVTGGLSNNTIAYTQGAFIPGVPTSVVRNQYSAICGSENKFGIGASVKPVIHGSNSDASTQPLPQPSCSDLLVSVGTSGPLLNYASDCADKTGLGKLTLTAKIVEFGNSLSDLKQSYTNLIDGGNTSSLLSSVTTMSPGPLKTLLLSKSPYLSDEVMIAYLLHPATVPYGHIEQVMLANSPITSEVKTTLNSLNLPNGIMNQINADQQGISARTILETQIIQTNYDQQLYINDKIRYFLNDTIETDPMDSVLYVLKTYPREDLACDLIQVYSTKGDYVKAIAIIDSLEAINKLDDYCRFQKLLIELNQAPEKCFKMKTDAATKIAIEDYANDCDKQSCPNAQALLKQVFNYQYPVLKMLPETNHSMIPQQSIEESINSDLGFLSLYPNPASEYLNIVFNNKDSEIGVIEIRNVLGELVDKIQIKNSENYLYNTEALDKSIYFVSLYVNGKLLENKKLILTK